MTGGSDSRANRVGTVTGEKIAGCDGLYWSDSPCCITDTNSAGSPNASCSVVVETVCNGWVENGATANIVLTVVPDG